jgi:hypothetical protein
VPLRGARDRAPAAMPGRAFEMVELLKRAAERLAVSQLSL